MSTNILSRQSRPKLFLLALAICAISGCTSRSIVVGGQSESSNAEAIATAQISIAKAEAAGCKAVGIGGGPSLAIGITVGESCVECQPISKDQRRQVFVVNVLLRCPESYSSAK